jgi:DNA-directed RNA polymerase alpha subunit
LVSEHIDPKKVVAREVLVQTARKIVSISPFRDRGFSERTIEALIARGIDMPERLLFATEAELKQIPGIGKASLQEIMKYRARFLPERI